MSRIGKVPVTVPQGVTINKSGQTLTVKGPKGELQQTFRPEMDIQVEEGSIVVTRRSDRKEERALHGLTRALIQNMVTGVTQGFERVLLIEGVGYRANLQGQTLNLSLGYSHPVSMAAPEGISFAVDGTQTIKVSGIDRQLVGQVAADIRKLRKVEPYKGKGIRYSGERVRRKAGKTGK